MDAAAPVRPVLRLLTAALAVVAGMGVASWWSVTRLTETFHWVDHAHQVIYELESTLLHAVSIQSGARGYALTGEDRFLAPYEAGLVRIQQSVAKLKTLTADSLRQQSRVSHLAALVNEEVAVMQERLAARRKGGLAAASAATADGRGKRVVDAVRGVVAAMQQEERTLLAERSQAVQFHGQIALLILALGLLVAALLVGGAMRRVRRLTLPV